MSYDFLPKELQALGEGSQKIYNFLNTDDVLSPVFEDTYLRTEMENVIDLVQTGKLVEIVRELLD